ncbi:MAG: hypothetical protein ACR2OL_16050 [Anderseniella sp.]
MRNAIRFECNALEHQSLEHLGRDNLVTGADKRPMRTASVYALTERHARQTPGRAASDYLFLHLERNAELIGSQGTASCLFGTDFTEVLRLRDFTGPVLPSN